MMVLGAQARREHGGTMALVMMALLIMSMIMLYIFTASMSSALNTHRKTQRSLGMAAADSGAEKILAALNAKSMDETTGYQLSMPEAQKLLGTSGVTFPSAAAPATWKLTPTRMSGQYDFIAREFSGNNFVYWQIMDVIEPRYMLGRESDLVIYFRAWASNVEAVPKITTKPRIFRVEFRPGYFSDYQQVSDGPIMNFKGEVWRIEGPVHSNGYPGPDWFSGDTKGIKSQGTATCNGRARFSTSNEAEIDVPGCDGGFIGGISRKRSREVDINQVNTTFKYMKSRCGFTYVICATGKGPYNVTLSPGGVQWTSENGGGGFAPLRPNIRDGATGDAFSAAVLFNDEIRVSGSLGSLGVRASRVTLAAYREASDALPANIILRGGSVGGSGTATVGMIAQGDVILDLPPEGQCLGNVNAAIATAGGGINLPGNLATLDKPAVDTSQSTCGAITLKGSFVGHNPLRTRLVWKKDDEEIGKIGYDRTNLEYGRELFANPPPLYPTARPWTMTKVGDAKNVCLRERAGDPKCA